MISARRTILRWLLIDGLVVVLGLALVSSGFLDWALGFRELAPSIRERSIHSFNMNGISLLLLIIGVSAAIAFNIRWAYATIAFLLACSLPAALASVVRSPGIHSTPGIWLILAGVPGTFAAVWLYDWIGEGFAFYAVIAAVNWVFYLGLVKGVLALKQLILQRRPQGVR